MKKIILIVIGTVVTLTIIGVWYYLFTYGAPKNSNEIFARFGIGGDGEIIPENTEPVTEQPTESKMTSEKKRLRQLTLKPVAGAVFRGDSIRYVEQGTGHIYDIDLGTTAETLVGGKTIPLTREAVFAHDGTYVAITAYVDNMRQTMVRKVNEPDSPIRETEIKLPLNARDIAFDQEGKYFSFIVPEETGAAGYRYTFSKETSERLYKIALRDVRALWGLTNYVYTTPTLAQKGFIYRVSGDNMLNFTTDGAPGLTGFMHNNDVIVTKFSDSKLESTLLNDYDRTSDPPTLSIPILPEKCASAAKVLVCGAPKESVTDQSFPDSWYKGTTSFSDSLWTINTGAYTSTLLIDILGEGGREVDVYKIGIDSEGKRVWFINKNDNTLWMYDMSI